MCVREEHLMLPLKLGLYTKAVESHLRIFIKGIILSALCSRKIPQAAEQTTRQKEQYWRKEDQLGGNCSNRGEDEVVNKVYGREDEEKQLAVRDLREVEAARLGD